VAEAAPLAVVARWLATIVKTGHSREDVERMLAGQRPGLLSDLRSTLAVGETYFYRQPGHFRFLVDWLSARRPTPPRIRAWSAGCATGEEAYSLAACLLGILPRGTPIEVLATDVAEPHLEVARRAEYGAWSLREAGPILWPLFDRSRPFRRIRDEVRKVVRFARADLMEPLPGDLAPWADQGFDVILCRNVLLYLTAPAAAHATALLSASLAPTGLVLFGTTDLAYAPPGLARVGPPELQAFIRSPAGSGAHAMPATTPSVAPRPFTSPETSTPAATPEVSIEATTRLDPIRAHLEAIVLIDRHCHEDAEPILDRLVERSPTYLPGLLELALLKRRLGRQAASRRLVRDLQERAAALSVDEIVAGPEPNTAGFYAEAARALLAREGAV
jgi:chemotaxis protein methyltransferase CheR